MPSSQYTIPLHSNSDSAIASSYLSFKDLCNVGILHSLEAGSGQSSSRGDSFQLPNPHFYPIHSRPGILDIFQEHLENDLATLHTMVKQREIAPRQKPSQYIKMSSAGDYVLIVILNGRLSVVTTRLIWRECALQQVHKQN